MKLLRLYVKQRKFIALYMILCVCIFLVVFALYHLPVEAVLYPAVICLILGALFLIINFYSIKNKHKMLTSIRKSKVDIMCHLPKISGIEDEDYQKIIELLCEEQKTTITKMTLMYDDMVEYYTTWVHQIKTPISAMRLKLQNEDSALARQLNSDLNRIEQYVEMVMAFLRLDSESSDFMFKEYELDTIARGAIRKFAGEFINRGIILDYTDLKTKVLTDEKWLSFVLEQIISNSLKYTKSGKIAVYLEEDKTICIQDTGIGIAPEDLPRIFDKGYTGYNGRSDKKASGLGLYLCKRICGKLGHEIYAESTLDEGTVVKINLDSVKLEVE